jgi:hypothetical protein
MPPEKSFTHLKRVAIGLQPPIARSGGFTGRFAHQRTVAVYVAIALNNG